MSTLTAPKAKSKRRSGNPALHLPPSAGVTNVAGQELLIIPLADFEDWLEDLALSRLYDERLNDGGEYITLEEFEKHLDQMNKGKK